MLITIKELQAGYLTSPYFKNIYLYLAQNKLLFSKAMTRQVEHTEEKYLLLDSLMLRMQINRNQENLALCLPESCVEHQSSLRTILTISKSFIFPI